jgi:hypothetical protein
VSDAMKEAVEWWIFSWSHSSIGLCLSEVWILSLSCVVLVTSIDSGIFAKGIQISETIRRNWNYIEVVINSGNEASGVVAIFNAHLKCRGLDTYSN